MNFNLSDEQNMFVESASRYVRERSNIEDKRKTAASSECFSQAHWAQFAEMGWLALTLPERADGLNCDINDLVILMEQVGRGVFHEPLIDTPVLCASLLSDANNSVADSLLSGIAMGENIIALAHIEADGRCEFSTEVNTSVQASDSGWTLNGSKQRVFYAPNANYLIVSAKLDEQLALFIVDANSAGIKKEAYRLIDGSHAADLVFENVELDKQALLLSGEPAKTSLNLALDKAIMADCARALGSMELVMEVTADYLKTREQYGKPLAQFQALQHRMAEMLVEYEQSQSIIYRALSLFNNPEERPAAVSAAKVLISKAGYWITSQSIQLHGGIGITDEYVVGHHHKAMVTLEQRFGDNEWHLDRCDSIIDSH